MSSFLTAQRAQQFEHDMQVLKKYICACSCIYDLFGLPRNHTPTPYIDFTRAHDCDDVYTPSIHSYGTPTPEVVYHRPPRDMSIPELIVEECSEEDECSYTYAKHDTHNTHDTHIATDTNGWPDHTPYEDTLTLPPLQMSHTELTDESSEVSSVSSVTSHHSTDTTDTTNSIDIVVPDDDLPERDVWDIL